MKHLNLLFRYACVACVAASTDASGLASGVYVYRLTAGSFVQSRKMVLAK